MKNFHERLHYCATAKGVNQTQVGKECGFQSGTVSRYFSGESVPKAMDLLKLATYFGVSMEWLLVGDEAREVRDLVVNEEAIPYEVAGKLTERGMKDIMAALEDFQETLKEAQEKTKHWRKNDDDKHIR
jgi:transcriptional regulator with XRE-family HTH domain